MLGKSLYNIEYAHFYIKDMIEGRIDEELSRSIGKTKEVISNLDKNSYVLSVLIDDYTEALDIKENDVFTKLKDIGLAPDFIIKESKITNLANKAIKLIKENYIDFRKKKGETVFEIETDDLLLWGENITTNPETRTYKSILLGEALKKKESNDRKNISHDVKQKENEGIVLARNTHTSKFEILLSYLNERNENKFTCALLTACWYLMRLVKLLLMIWKHI